MGRRRGKRLRWAAEYAAALIGAAVVRVLPFWAALRLGGALGSAAYRLDGRHRGIALDNIRKSFPEVPEEEAARIARTAFRNLGFLVVELIQSGRYGRRPVGQHFSFVNYEAFERADAKGKGVLFLTAHCGSWELMAMSQALLGRPFGVVVRPLDNPHLDRFVERIRARYGNWMISKTRGMREILGVLKDGGTVGILLDQNVTRAEGVFVDFFGRQACTNKGLALIAMKTKAPVVPAFARRVGPDRHEVVLGDELPLVETGDKEADVAANTQNYTRAIEDFVRRYPDQWFWMHRRWKTRPEGQRRG